jgi:hypothetical protein
MRPEEVAPWIKSKKKNSPPEVDPDAYGGLYSPPGIPPGIRLESRNSAGLTTEFDIPAEFTRNLMGILVS